MNKKIILIEDDKELQEIIKYNFSKEKYDIVLCSDGEDALDLIKHEMHDRVILDWMLTNVSGVECLLIDNLTFLILPNSIFHSVNSCMSMLLDRKSILNRKIIIHSNFIFLRPFGSNSFLS